MITPVRSRKINLLRTIFYLTSCNYSTIIQYSGSHRGKHVTIGRCEVMQITLTLNFQMSSVINICFEGSNISLFTNFYNRPIEFYNIFIQYYIFYNAIFYNIILFSSLLLF